MSGLRVEEAANRGVDAGQGGVAPHRPEGDDPGEEPGSALDPGDEGPPLLSTFGSHWLVRVSYAGSLWHKGGLISYRTNEKQEMSLVEGFVCLVLYSSAGIATS